MVAFEVALARAQAQLGIVPEESARAIGAQAQADRMDVAVLRAGVARAGVPVPALVAQLRQQVQPPHADWLHWGATSQDVIDTALSLAMNAAMDHIKASLGVLIDRLQRESETHRATPMLARTRGQLATPITFGLRIAQWAQPLIGFEGKINGLRSRALSLQFGGASGSLSAVAPHGAEIARHLAEELGLAAGPPWHTDRSRLRSLTGWLDRLLAALAKIGQDVALAARREIAELAAGQGGGSSTMPHKSNPVQAEALQTAAVLGRSLVAGMSASAVHSEERDGVSWPAEWYLLPKLFVLAAAALEHAQALIEDLRPDAAAMSARIDANPEVWAEAAQFALAPKLGRAEAQKLVAQALASDAPFPTELARLAPDEIDWNAVFSLETPIAAAQAVAHQIFAERKPKKDDG